MADMDQRRRPFLIYPGNASTLTKDGAQSALEDLNDQMALRYLPVIIYILILMITGIVGNILVCTVYISSKKCTSVSYFIMTLASLDLLNCVIGMPNEIVDLRYPYMFYSPTACKVLRTIEYISTVGSTVVLLAVAVDRYNRICKLGKHMPNNRAKKFCFAAVIIGVVTSWPVPILGGLNKMDVNLGKEHDAVDCSIEEEMRQTVYPTILYGLLGIYFVGCIIFFVVIYSKIIIFVKKRKAITRHLSDNKDDSVNPNSDLETHRENGNSTRKLIEQAENSNKPRNGHGIKVTRTTVVLGVVTFTFIIGYLPYLTIMAIRTVVSDFDDNLTAAEDVGIKFCVKSYLINNAINPIIYCFLNRQFREDVKKLFRKIHFKP